MVTLGMLWLPIVVSAVVVFVASAVMWMVMPHHRSDWQKLPGQDTLLEAMRGQKVTPGQYTFPFALPKEMKDPEIKKKLEEGPVGMMVVMPSGQPPMGKSMALSVIHDLVVSVLVAYLAGRTLAAGTDYLAVFRVAGTAAVLGYAGSIATGAIWFGRSWSSTFKEIGDGVVYGLLTAGVFGWLWPAG
jgi:hypothetical protein